MDVSARGLDLERGVLTGPAGYAVEMGIQRALFTADAKTKQRNQPFEIPAELDCVLHVVLDALNDHFAVAVAIEKSHGLCAMPSMSLAKTSRM